MPAPHSSITSVANPDPHVDWPGEAAASTVSARRGFVSQIAREEWLIGLACLAIDIVSWITIYGLITYLRSDQFIVGPFEFLLVDVIQLTFICQALFMIGGYDRKNDTRTLTYMAE